MLMLTETSTMPGHPPPSHCGLSFLKRLDVFEENVIESFKPHAKNYTGHRSFDQFLILKLPGMNQRSDTECQTATEGVRKPHLSMSSVSLPVLAHIP